VSERNITASKEKNYPQLISYSEPILNSKLVLDRKEIIHLYLAEAYFEQKEFAKAASNYDLFIASKNISKVCFEM
jgi:hypothetical protein